MAVSVWFVSRLSRVGGRSSGGLSLGSLSTPGPLLYTRLTALLLSSKKRSGGFCRLAVSTQRLIVNRFVFVHFIDLLDGSPRSAPPSNVMWELPRGVDGICVEGLIITGSRIMIHFLCWEEVGQGEVELCKVLVWDWETGDLVRLLWLEQSHFTYSTSDTQPFIHRS